jgi:hypothetical protein
MNAAHLRAWWAHRQGLVEPMEGNTPTETLERSGWSRSIGGVNPYLGIFARCGATRLQVDQALADRALLELPSARGCTYVLPQADFQLGLVVGEQFRETEMKTARKLGVTDDEIERLCQAVLLALESEDKDPAALKVSVGDAARSLGEEGKKKGVTTTLPVALSRLQAKGEILRKPLNGRLDSQRYAYTLWRNGPAQMAALDLEEAQLQVAKRFFSWIGPATAAQFATLLAISLRSAKAILDKVPLVPVQLDSDEMILASDLDAFRSFAPPTEPVVRLVGLIDNLFHLRREMPSHLADEDLSRCQASEKGLVPLGQAQELSNNAITDRGRIIGLWEYDHDRAEIVWCSFVAPFHAMRQEVTKTEAFIRDQLGDARTFSLDSPQSRRPKIEALRAMGSQSG